MNLRNFFRALLGTDHIKEQLMALNDATSRIEASVAALGADIATQLSAISSEITALAAAVNSGGDTSAVEARLNAAADQLDALATQVTESTSQLQADDALAPTDGGSTDAGTAQ